MARVSFFVVPVIADNAIAALPVAHGHGLSNGAPQLGAINAAPPDGSIIVIGNVLTAADWPNGNGLKHRLPTLLQFHPTLCPTKKT